MSQKINHIKLNKQERKFLREIIKSGKGSARKITRSRILLLADKGKTDKEIADALDVCLTTIYYIRQRYCREGLEDAINEKPRSGQPIKITGKAMAKITAIACSKPPEGHARWSLRLLADRIVELNIVKTISYQSVRTILKKK
jgi:transposase